MNYEFALKNRQSVLNFINEDKTHAVIEILNTGRHVCKFEDPDCPDSIKILQEQIIEALVRKINDENYRDIFDILNRLPVFFGLNLRLCIEISLLNISRNIDLPLQIRYMDNLPGHLRNDPVMQLIEAETLRQTGRSDRALTLYNQVPIRESWWPFTSLWEELTRGLACYMMEMNQQFLARQSFPDKGWSPDAQALRPLISGLLSRQAGSAQGFKGDIERVIWNTPVPGIDVGGLVISFLCDHITDLDADRAATVFHLAVSFDKQADIQRILSQKMFVSETLSLHPLFIKYFDIFSQKNISIRGIFLKCLNAFLQSSFCLDFRNGNLNAFSFSVLDSTPVWATEVLSRYRARLNGGGIRGIPFLNQPRHDIFLRTGGENHTFIGIFGQMRDPQGSFSKIMKYLHADTAQYRAAGKRLSIGIATWNLTGQKNIEDGTLVGEFLSRIPRCLQKIISTNHIKNLLELRNILPHTADALQKASCTNNMVDEGIIRSIASQNGFHDQDIFINIETEDQYLKDIGKEFRSFYKRVSVGIENQARMWHRIAALYGLAKQATQKTAQPIGNMALIRPDVLFRGGSIINLIEKAVHQTSEDVAICDYDPHAYWIEGVGDRYFAGRATAVARAFDGKDLILQIMRDPVLSTHYQDRPFWHRFAQTIFYESDVFLQQSAAIDMEFLRQSIPLDVLKPALQKDYVQISDHGLKDLIKRFVSAS
ncbi:hypothetical protein LV478_14685 [Komagataeibacter oboediens]|uniref:hypothetical protein n=1 Tax=Komagataeibacter oboediens TaxID=65958 RepID=UPI0023DC6D35|nr:hypothetical protein [Komagataeibacter oboediens]WEQ51747.1 hypothetical protein LV478_14685 [Komagataeibacter oboediens]